jgi:hypothetical protein
VADAYASLDVQAEGWCTGFVRSRFGDAAALGHAYQHMRQQTGEHDPQKVLVLLRRLQQWALAKRAKDHILQLVEHLDHLAMGFKDKYKG